MSAQWRRIIWSSTTAGLLWLVVGGVAQALVWVTRFGSLLRPIVPQTMPGNVWMWPGAWGYSAAALGALGVAGVTAAILALDARGTGFGRAVSGQTWLAVIIAGTVVGIATDVAGLLGFGPIPGIGEGIVSRLSIADLGSSAATGAYFGVLYGWVAALVARAVARAASRAESPAGIDPDQASADELRGGPRRPGAFVGRVVPVLVAAALLVGYTVASTAGARVHSQVTQAEARAAEDAAAAEAGRPRTGAVPDPAAEGESVPERAAQTVPRETGWCGRDDVTLLLGLTNEELETGDRGNPDIERGTHDAAAGHRVMPLRAVNITDAPCVLEGYPDVAFADQNGHLLDVAMTQGGSFMATDAGPVAVTLQPGEAAIARLGWNANSTQGALVAAEVYAAPLAGDTRDAWQLEVALDIVAGSEATVTAWELAPPPEQQ